METVRTFVAIELPRPVKDGLTGIRKELDRAGRDVVKWVGADSIHLTLKFLGEIPAAMVPQVNAALEEASRGIAPFTLQAGELGFFPNANRPRVFWKGLKGDLDELLRLQENVELALEALGYQREARGFSPHLTLARFKDYSDNERLRTFVEQANRIGIAAGSDIPVNGLSLMHSVLKPEGAVHTRLAFIPLME